MGFSHEERPCGRCGPDPILRPPNDVANGRRGGRPSKKAVAVSQEPPHQNRFWPRLEETAADIPSLWSRLSAEGVHGSGGSFVLLSNRTSEDLHLGRNEPGLGSKRRDRLGIGRNSVFCGLENLPTNKIFLPSIRRFFDRKKRAGSTGRKRVIVGKTSAPNPGIWGRKILMVGKFSETDRPARSHVPSSGCFMGVCAKNYFAVYSPPHCTSVLPASPSLRRARLASAS